VLKFLRSHASSKKARETLARRRELHFANKSAQQGRQSESMFEANCSSAWFWSKLQHASFCLILMPEKSVMSVGREDSSVSETWRSVARLGKEGGPRRWSANSLLETAQRILICDFPVLHSMVCASINSTNPCTGSSIACHSVIHI